MLSGQAEEHLAEATSPPEAGLDCRTAPSRTDHSCSGRRPSTAPGCCAGQHATPGTGWCCNRQAAGCHARVLPRSWKADRHARGARQKARNIPSIPFSRRKASSPCRASRARYAHNTARASEAGSKAVRQGSQKLEQVLQVQSKATQPLVPQTLMLRPQRGNVNQAHTVLSPILQAILAAEAAGRESQGHRLMSCSGSSAADPASYSFGITGEAAQSIEQR